MQHGIGLPFLLQVHDLQSLKQLFLALEISLEGIAQQRLAETAGTGKEDILILVDQAIHHICLVNIHFAIFTNLLKLVGIYGVLESAHIVSILSKIHLSRFKSTKIKRYFQEIEQKWFSRYVKLITIFF